MKEENLIHVRIDNSEGIRSKRDVLSSEMNLLKAAKAMERYFSLRREELKLKSSLSRKIRSSLVEIKKIQVSLPTPHGQQEFQKEKIMFKETIKKDSLESQLNDIRDKLRAIGG